MIKTDQGMRRIFTIPVFILWLFFRPGFLRAQDTLIVYDIASQTIDTLLPVATGASVAFAKTSSSTGTMGNKATLSQVPPTTNLFSGSDFCDITKAANSFNLSSYPARTAVALRYYRGDSLKTGCSGILVSPSAVLTAGHCVYDYFTRSFSKFDSLKICPAYNNGMDHPALPVSMAKKIYIFKTYYHQSTSDDIALIQLEEPIGLQTGWVGIGYEANLNNYQNKVLHKFSYPCRDLFGNRVFNGDTMYYNYGYINITSTYLGINSPAATGVQGQSGSSFLYTDNTDYYAVGVFNYSNTYYHYPIRQNVFTQLEHVLTSYATGMSEEDPVIAAPDIYPNPFNKVLHIDAGERKAIVLKLSNSLGQVLKEVSISSATHTEINTGDLAPGLYFLWGEADGRPFSAKYVKE